VLGGVVVIPVDAAASPHVVARTVRVAEPRGVLLGEALQLEDAPITAKVWRVRDVHWVDSWAAASLPEHTVPRADVDPDTIAEIVFTSGTTGDPKGVIVTHRNIVANIRPVDHDIAAYRPYLWPFRPIRFLSLLPLSHMFGQALSVFFPPLVDAATVFTNSYSPDQIMEHIRVIASRCSSPYRACWRCSAIAWAVSHGAPPRRSRRRTH
jgi:long-chain acyl-CoA synthetase